VQKLLQWKSSNYEYYIFRVCGCSLRYPAYDAHTSHGNLWLSWPTIYVFPHCLINGMIFGKKKMLLNIKRVLRLSLQIASEKFLILRRTERDVIKNYIDIHVKYLFLLSDFNEI
jgi:hypothetical protein